MLRHADPREYKDHSAQVCPCREAQERLSLSLFFCTPSIRRLRYSGKFAQTGEAYSSTERIRLEYTRTMNEGVVSKETVVLRRWGSSIQKFGFINGVDNVNWPPYRDSKSYTPELNPLPSHLTSSNNAVRTGERKAAEKRQRDLAALYSF